MPQKARLMSDTLMIISSFFDSAVATDGAKASSVTEPCLFLTHCPLGDMVVIFNELFLYTS